MKNILSVFVLLFILLFLMGCSNSSQKAYFYYKGEVFAELKVARTTFLQYSSVQSNTDTFGMTSDVVGVSNPDAESIEVLSNSALIKLLEQLAIPEGL